MKPIKKRVLVVSADAPFKELVGEVLRSYGHTVFLADTGYRALRDVKDNLFDAVVLDHETPFMKHRSMSESRDTLQAITDQNPFLPVVLTCRSRNALDHSTLLMADMVLETPVKYSALVDAVETLLNETLRERAHRKAEDVRVFI
ncbi:MAG TPA: hypothetical protein VN673_12265 [Clostridia bacterium]|nr:hypothetical protein [Clostridia bacterium]